MLVSINSINLGAALINRPISDAFNGFWNDGTSCVCGARPPFFVSESTAIYHSQGRIQPRDFCKSQDPRESSPGLSFQVYFGREFLKFAKKYQLSAITKSSAQIKSKTKYKYKWNKWSYFTHQLLAKTSPQRVRIVRVYRGKTSFLYNNKTSLNHCQSKAAIFMLLD